MDDRRWTIQAIQCLRNRNRGEALADPLRPGQDEARRQRLALNRLRQQAHQSAMTHNLFKCHTFADRITSATPMTDLAARVSRRHTPAEGFPTEAAIHPF
jgi:hypothetical protein